MSYLSDMSPEELVLCALVLALGLFKNSNASELRTLINILNLTTENLIILLEQSEGSAQEEIV